MASGLPEFLPEGGTAENAQIAIAGRPVNNDYNGPSMMERAQRLRVDKERHQQQMADNKLFQPIKEAKAKADLAEANAHLDAVATTEQTRGKIADVLPQARNEFDSIMTMENINEREKAAFSWMGKYGQFSNIQALSPEWTAKKNVLASMVQESTGVRVRQAQSQAVLDQINARGKVAKDVAGVRATTPRGYQALVAAYQAAVDDGDTETADLLRPQIEKQNHINQPYSDAERIKTLDTEAKAAEADGDAALAKSLRDRITYLTKRSNPGASLDELLNKKYGGQQQPTTPQPGQNQQINTTPNTQQPNPNDVWQGIRW